MDGYTIQIKTSVEKDLRHLPGNVVSHILDRIVCLTDDPVPHDAVKLSGSDKFFRIRVGDYRIIYEIIHKERYIIIYYVRHRRVAYRNF